MLTACKQLGSAPVLYCTMQLAEIDLRGRFRLINLIMLLISYCISLSTLTVVDGKRCISSLSLSLCLTLSLSVPLSLSLFLSFSLSHQRQDAGHGEEGGEVVGLEGEVMMLTVESDLWREVCGKKDGCERSVGAGAGTGGGLELIVIWLSTGNHD
jgi:hypothetical protein